MILATGGDLLCLRRCAAGVGVATVDVIGDGADGDALLERGKGDCTEYALLTVTLLRARVTAV